MFQNSRRCRRRVCLLVFGRIACLHLAGSRACAATPASPCSPRCARIHTRHRGRMGAPGLAVEVALIQMRCGAACESNVVLACQGPGREIGSSRLEWECHFCDFEGTVRIYQPTRSHVSARRHRFPVARSLAFNPRPSCTNARSVRTCWTPPLSDRTPPLPSTCPLSRCNTPLRKLPGMSSPKRRIETDMMKL